MKSLMLTLIALTASAPAAFAKEIELKVVCAYDRNFDRSTKLTIKGEAEDVGSHLYVNTNANASQEILRKDGRVFKLKTRNAYVFPNGWTLLSMTIQDQPEDGNGESLEAESELSSHLRLNKMFCYTEFLKVK